MDQRCSLQKSLAKEKGSAVTDAMMEEFKSLVTEVLTPHASAILLESRVGDCRHPSAELRMPACCWLMKRPDMTKPAPAACLISSTTGLPAA
jgi:tagatose-1,6-bisphosphate aldolase